MRTAVSPTLVLRFVGGGPEQPPFVVHPSQRVRMGRVPPNDLIVPLDTMSRRHAWFWCEDGQWMVEDAGSTSGIFINEEAIGQRKAPLPFGAQVRVGGVRFHVEAGAPDAPPTVPVLPLPTR